TGNTAAGLRPEGNGVWLDASATVLDLRDNIIAGNLFPSGLGQDVSGRLGSRGHNLVGVSAGGSGYHPSDLLDVDPLLGPLEENGGLTWTHALLPGSPALDAGDPAGAPAFDPRGEGVARIAGKNIDIGAYERQESGRGATHPGFDVAALLAADLKRRPR